jgi:hypothetical protein
MRQWTLLCVWTAFVADVAATVLLLAGRDTALPLVAIGSAAAVTAVAGVLLLIKPRSVAHVGAETPVPSAVDSPKSVSPSFAALESAEPVPPDGEPLDNRPWLKLVEESVTLFDELDRHRADFDAPRQEVADHVICRLQEILERCGVEPISGDGNFDRSRHQPEGATRVLPGATVAEIVSPGFRVGKRVLRRARVRVHNPAAPDAPT